jgi:hypothetical protein
MGILQTLFNNKAKQAKSTNKLPPEGNDQIGVTDEIWNYLCPNNFASITKNDIIDAIEFAYPNLKKDKAAALLGDEKEGLKAKASYKLKSRAEFEKLLKDILPILDKNKVVKLPKALKLKPGESITGGVHGPGSIGGFLTNDKREIFLFGDAHVLVKMINAPVSGTTPESQLKDKSKQGNSEIGTVVCSGQIQVGGLQNYDIALTKIDVDYYKYISLQYEGSSPQTNAKRFFVTAVETQLRKGQPVFLYGFTSGYVEGKLLTIQPADIPNAPYGGFIGAATNQNITLHNCIIVEPVTKDAILLSSPGDSGGLWVSEHGKAVGIQVLGGIDDPIAWIHPMTLVMEYFHLNYDGNLRFLTANDLWFKTVTAEELWGPSSDWVSR